MPSVLIPQKKNEVQRASSEAGMLPKAFTLLGGMAGGIIGTPAGGAAGALAGAQIGAGIGRVVGDVAEDNTLGQRARDRVMVANQAEGAVPESNSAASRRQLAMQQDPYETIKQANFALAYAPKDIQDQYRKPLGDAYDMALRERQSSGMYG